MDGRRVAGGSLTVDAVVEMAEPLPLVDYPDGQGVVGTVDAIGELAGVGVGVGRTNLPSGEYPVAITLDDTATELQGDVLVVTEGRLRSVCLSIAPAWPDAMIVVHP